MPAKKIIAVFNQKGGVGKSTTSVNLAATLAALGLETLVVDLDAQGNSTRNLHMTNFPLKGSYDLLLGTAPLEEVVNQTRFPKLKIICATTALAGLEAEVALAEGASPVLRNSLRQALNTEENNADIVIIDCPPAFGITTINALAASHQVILPVRPETFAFDGLNRTMRTLRRIKSDLNKDLEQTSILITMLSGGSENEEPLAQTIRAEYGRDVFDKGIHRDPNVVKASALDLPVSVLDPSSPAATDYLRLSVQFLETITGDAVTQSQLEKLYKKAQETLSSWHKAMERDGDLQDLPGFTRDREKGPEEEQSWATATESPPLPPSPSTKSALALGSAGLIIGIAIGVLLTNLIG